MVKFKKHSVQLLNQTLKKLLKKSKKYYNFKVIPSYPGTIFLGNFFFNLL